MADRVDDERRGALASSREFATYDQVDKPDYHLAEGADTDDAFDEQFSFTTLDLQQYLRGNASDRRNFATSLHEAMSDIGFAILEGHGVALDLLEAAEDWVAELFTSTTLEDKMRFRASRHGAVDDQLE